MAVNKEARIEQIVTMLSDGMEVGEICRILSESVGKDKRTIERDIKQAKLIILERNKTKEAIRGTILSETLKTEIQAEILTEQELDLIMSRIVDGNIEVREYIKGVAVIRDTSPMEIIAAADKLYKRKGSYAAVKTANTRPDGSELPDANFTDEQVDNILNAIKDSKAL